MSGLRRRLRLRARILDRRRCHRLVDRDAPALFVQRAAVKVALDVAVLRATCARQVGVVCALGRVHMHGRLQRTGAARPYRSNLQTHTVKRPSTVTVRGVADLVVVYHSDLGAGAARGREPVLRRGRGLGWGRGLDAPRPHQRPFAGRKLGGRGHFGGAPPGALVPVQHHRDTPLQQNTNKIIFLIFLKIKKNYLNPN